MNGNGTSALLVVLGDLPLGEVKDAIELYKQYKSLGRSEEAQMAFLILQIMRDAYVDLEKIVWLPEIADAIKTLVDEYRVGG